MAWKVGIFIMMFCYCFVVIADYQDPVIRTNVNDQTKLFEEEINGWDKMQYDEKQDHKTRLQNLSVGSEINTIKGKVEKEDEKKTVEGHSNEVASMSYEEAESAGRSKMFEENTIEELYVDYTQPLYKAYLEDAKDIAREQDEFFKKHLTAALHDFGVDCKTVKGDKVIEPEVYLQSAHTLDESHDYGIGRGDTVYNQTICEFLRNQYQCHDELTMQCRRFSEKEFESVKFDSSDISSSYSTYGGVSNYYFDTNCVGTTCVRRGKNPNALRRLVGHRKKHKETHTAAEEEFSIYFDINDDIAIVNRLEMTDIEYNGVMSISLNDTNISVLPIGGTSLNIIDTHSMRSGGKKNKKWKKTYSVISNGHNNYVLTYERDTGDSGGNIQHILRNQSYGDLNLKSYARRGRNVLRIKIVSLNGYVRFNFRISERICLEWQEIWDEKCQLK